MSGYVLITGAARRGGKAIAEAVHARGFKVVLQCRAGSLDAATALAAAFNQQRPHSALVWSQELCIDLPAPPVANQIVGVVANASTYRKSSLENFEITMQGDMDSHVYGHLAIIRHCEASLRRARGAVVSIGDIHTERPARDYLSYTIAKGALAAATRALAAELAPDVRVNAVFPGPLEWPAHEEVAAERKQRIIDSTPLGRVGTFEELAAAVCFLLFDASFTTGAVLPVDGGRAIHLD